MYITRKTEMMADFYVQTHSIAIIIMYVIISSKTPISVCLSHSTTSACSNVNFGVRYKHTYNRETITKLFITFQNTGFVQCQKHCLRHAVCESITYDVIMETCKINSDSLVVTGDPSGNFIYLSRTSISTNTQVCE